MKKKSLIIIIVVVIFAGIAGVIMHTINSNREPSREELEWQEFMLRVSAKS
jgi:Flp pilus assembly protein CpaB